MIAIIEIIRHGDQWRLQQALGRTWIRRPDLLEQCELGTEEQALLDEFIADTESVAGRSSG